MIDVRKISFALAEFLAPLKGANWKVILLCFSTAATFWFFNALNKVYTTRINYPVDLNYNRDSLVMVKDPPEQVPINVTGGGWQLLKRTISVNKEPVIIDPENPVQTQFFTAASLLPVFANQLTDLNVNYVATDTIFFKIEPYASRQLVVKLDSSTIQLKEDHFITSNLYLEPDTVDFRGPKSLIDKLPEAFMVSLSDKDIDNRYDEELSLDLFSPSLIKKTPEVIHIKFDVEEYISESTSIDVELVNFPYDSSIYIENSNVDVTYKLQRSFKNKVKKEDFLIIVDLNDIHNVDSTLSLEVMDLPNYVMDFAMKSNRVNVIYDK